MQQLQTPPGARIAGIWLPLITPFADGVLDAAALPALVRYYLDAAIDGLILAATTGEGMTLDDQETQRLVSVAAEAAAGQVPVFLGLSGSDTRRLVARLAATRGWPIAGYLVACPYYTRPSQSGLLRHFSELAANTSHPIMVYNIPYRTGVNLANDTLLALAELDAIVGVKDCCADPRQSFALIRQRPPGFAVMTGEDTQFYSAISQGADGGILASAHVAPDAFVALHRAWRARETDAALTQWSDLVELVYLMFAEPSPAPIKHWLWCQGLLRSPELRLPMTGVSDALAAAIAREAAQRTNRQ